MKKKRTIVVYDSELKRFFRIQITLQKEKDKRITQPEAMKHILNKYEEVAT